MKTHHRILAGMFAVALGALLVPLSSTPALGGDCLEGCKSAKAECDGRCDRTRLTCIVACGIPMTPGYNDCKQACDGDQQTCSYKCIGEQKACEVACRVPK